jgi:carboxylesterase
LEESAERSSSTLVKNIWELQQLIHRGKATGRTRQMLLRAHSQLVDEMEGQLGIEESDRAVILAREDSRDGVLLIHGTTGSPEDLRGMARFLHEGGFNTYCMRLPGHGLPEGNEGAASWEACVDEVLHRYRVLSDCCKNVYVVGYSFGAALALQLDLSPRPRALVLIAPAIYPRLGLFQRILVALGLDRLQWVRRHLGWRVEVLEAMNAARRHKWWYGVPVLALMAGDDRRIDPRSLNFLRSRVTHHRTQIHQLPAGGHQLHLGEHRDEVHRMALSFIKEN